MIVGSRPMASLFALYSLDFQHSHELQFSMKRHFLCLAAWLAPVMNGTPYYPVGAHVNLYFPHLADGGPASQNWQTAFVLCNPDSTAAAHVTITIYGDNGSALALDFG
jgi:hypothetical protein